MVMLEPLLLGAPQTPHSLGSVVSCNASPTRAMEAFDQCALNSVI